MVCYNKEPDLTPAFAMQGSSAFFQGVVYNTSTLLNKPGLQTYKKPTDALQGAPSAFLGQASKPSAAQFDWATVGRKQ
jgi:hypothetical protein